MKRTVLTLMLVMALMLAGISMAQDSEREGITVDNASNLSLLMRLGRGSADFVAWSPDGASILVGGSIGVWTYDATALDTELEPPVLNVGGEIETFDISPDGSTIALAHSDGDGVEFRDAATGNIMGTYETDLFISNIAYSPDGAYLTINGSSNGVEVVDIASGTQWIVADASLNSDVPVLINSDGSYLAAATRSNTIAVWDFVNGGDPVSFEGHTSTINDMAFSPNGSLIAAASSDDSVRVWAVADASEIAVVTEGGGEEIRDVYAVAWSNDGTQIFTGHSGLVRVWDAATATQTAVVEVAGDGRVEDIVVSPDGTQMIALTDDFRNAVQLFSIDGTAVSAAVGHNAYMYASEFSPDNSVLALSDQDRVLYMWDTATAGEITSTIQVEDGATSGISNRSNITFTSDNTYMATLQSFSVTLRNPTNGNLILEYEVDGIAEDLDFSPDNSMIAIITSQAFYVFETATGNQLAAFEDANDWLQGVAWSPDQTMISVVAGDHAVRVYTIGG